MPKEGAFHHLIIVSYPRQDKRSKGNGCAIQHDFMLLTVRPVSIETESLKYNDMELIRGPVNGENKYPSDPLITIHRTARLIPAAT
ncbi:hypothetical protein TNCV_1270211 [Trichonephila clavipes]|nr:hypothetical protein TNCV_1270211 [Trichonephila clavipes]